MTSKSATLLGPSGSDYVGSVNTTHASSCGLNLQSVIQLLAELYETDNFPGFPVSCLCFLRIESNECPSKRCQRPLHDRKGRRCFGFFAAARARARSSNLSDDTDAILCAKVDDFGGYQYHANVGIRKIFFILRKIFSLTERLNAVVCSFHEYHLETVISRLNHPERLPGSIQYVT